MNESKPVGSNRRGANGKFFGPSLWLCLSGGGTRAALFHYGCFKRLHELGLLAHVNAMSATSGGAIVAALADRSFNKERSGLHSFDWDKFENNMLLLARKGMLGPALSLTVALTLYAMAGATLAAGIILYLLRVSWAGVHLWSVWWASAPLFLGALTIHVALGIWLYRRGAHQASESARAYTRMMGPDADCEWARPSVPRLLRMLASPSYLRLQTLNLMSFKGRLLRFLNPHLRTYFTSVDLNTGREFVFTSGVVTDLSRVNCSSLWDQRTSRPEATSDRIEIADAVAASSAFPPLFSPVAVNNHEGLIGVFVDGGVLDNFALNVPRAFAVHIHADRGQRYDGDKYALPSFREEISFLLGFDGGAPPKIKNKKSWSRLFTPRRLVGILLDQQSEAALTTGQELHTHVGIGTALLGLHLGFPLDHALDDKRLTDALAAVRTHFDSFSREECAVIAYSGYTWVDYLVKDKPKFLTDYEGAAWKDPCALKDFLPASAGPWNSSLEGLVRHLRYSDRRLGLHRWVGRRLGI